MVNMVQYMLPDSHGMLFSAVECAVYKFDLWNAVFQKEIQFLLYFI